MIAASSLSDLLHSYESMVNAMFLATKQVSKDTGSPHSAEISVMRNQVKMDWGRCIKDRKDIEDHLASDHPTSASRVFEGGIEGTNQWIQGSVTGLED